MDYHICVFINGFFFATVLEEIELRLGHRSAAKALVGLSGVRRALGHDHACPQCNRITQMGAVPTGWSSHRWSPVISFRSSMGTSYNSVWKERWGQWSDRGSLGRGVK
jgi:hypothetical protein